MQKLIILFTAITFLGSCGMKDLKIENEVLQSELSELQKSNTALYEIGILLDSIDANRNNLYFSLESGSTQDEYVKRVEGINEYVKQAEKQIDDLMKDLERSEMANEYFAASLKRLQDEVKKKNNQVKVLMEQIDNYGYETDALLTLTEMQEMELADKDLEIMYKSEELAYIQARIEGLLIQAEVSEADAYYARGEAVEVAAKRTKLAPRKRKETYKEALELYEKSLELGKAEAQVKVDELKAKIN